MKKEILEGKEKTQDMKKLANCVKMYFSFANLVVVKTKDSYHFGNPFTKGLKKTLC